MLLIALKRLWNRMGLTLLSILAVTLAVGLVVSIPVFAKAYQGEFPLVKLPFDPSTMALRLFEVGNAILSLASQTGDLFVNGLQALAKLPDLPVSPQEGASAGLTAGNGAFRADHFSRKSDQRALVNAFVEERSGAVKVGYHQGIAQ